MNTTATGSHTGRHNPKGDTETAVTDGYRIVRLDGPAPPDDELRFDRFTANVRNRAERAAVARVRAIADDATPPTDITRTLRPRRRPLQEQETADEDLLDALEEREGVRGVARAWLDVARAVRRTDALSSELLGKRPEREPGSDGALLSDLLVAEGLTDEEAALCVLAFHWRGPRIRQILDLLESQRPGALTVLGEGRQYDHGRRYRVDPEDLRARRIAAGVTSVSALSRLVAERIPGSSVAAIRGQLQRCEQGGSALPAEVYAAVSALLTDA
jgi:hypothetical protein